MRLSFHIREINLERLMFGKELLQIGPHRLERTFSAQKNEGLAQISHSVGCDSFTMAASCALATGTKRAVLPRRRASIAIGNTP